jgi:peptide chain release factor 2
METLQRDFLDIKELAELNLEGVESQMADLLDKIVEVENRAFMSGKYDKRNAILQIFSGAGGQDAQDWVAILLRMYQKYLVSKGYDVRIVEESFGEGGGPDGRVGIKEVTFEVKGDWAFGILRSEKGVHRLVRISPFSSKKLRHTSFAKVDVIPEIDFKDQRTEIPTGEIKVDTYKASGPGGQNVNKRETAIRVTHLPTGLTASSQNERHQAMNKDKAMSILASKLARLREEERDAELSKVRGEKVSVGWGNQIRSYVLHPYKMVKDLRTGVETSQVEAVLDGDLDLFIKSGIRLDIENKR